MFLKLFLVVSFVLIPSLSFAWGPLTHVYLGNEIYYLGALLPAGVLKLLKKYREDYLYGNLMADTILAKKLLPAEKNTHSWEVALSLFESAQKSSEKAFSLGYMSHLAADTVAHNIYTPNSKNIEHTFLELRADSLIARRYWAQAVRINKQIRYRNDIFLEKSVDPAIFTFKTNKRIFRGIVFLSVFNRERFGNFIDRNLIFSVKKEDIKKLHAESIDRMIDVLCNRDHSAVLKKNPIAQ
jgi:hypothetical protein